MGYSDLIAREAEDHSPGKQAEILDFIAFLKTRHTPVVDFVPKTAAAEVEAFFRSFKVNGSGYRFDRDDANAR